MWIKTQRRYSIPMFLERGRGCSRITSKPRKTVFMPLATSPGLRIWSPSAVFILDYLLWLNHAKNQNSSLYCRIHNSLKNRLIHKVQILIYTINLKFFFKLYKKHKIKVQVQKHLFLWIGANIVWFAKDTSVK